MAPTTNHDSKKYSWKKASELLTDVEKNRLCCLLLTCLDQVKPTSDDFRAAALEFNSAQGGFTKMYQTTIKKLKDNDCYFQEVKERDEGDTATTQDASSDTTPPTPKTAATPGTTKRKNAKASAEGASPKKKGRPSKAAIAAKVKKEAEQSGEEESAAEA